MAGWIVIAVMLVGLVVVAIGRVVLGRGGSASVVSVAVALVVLVAVLAAIYTFERAAVNVATQPYSLPTPATQLPPFATPGDNNAISP